MKKRNITSEIVTKAWNDEKFKGRLLKNPKEAIKEIGVELHPDLKVKVIENTNDTIYIVLPQKPKTQNKELEVLQGFQCRTCGGPSSPQA